MKEFLKNKFIWLGIAFIVIGANLSTDSWILSLILKNIALFLGVYIISNALLYRDLQGKENLLGRTEELLGSVEKVIKLQEKTSYINDYLQTTVSYTSHSLKNAISSMSGILYNLDKDNLTDSDIESLRIGLQNIELAVENFQKFGVSSEQKQFPLSQLIDVVDMLQKGNAKKYGAALSIEYQNVNKDTPLPHNFYDIYQVLDNLLVNAYEAVEQQDRREVRLIVGKFDEKNVSFQVCDTGLGISKENLAKIFDLNFTTKNGELKRGIGLNHVKYIVEEAKGKIAYKGTNQEYSAIFEIILPITI